MKRRIFKKNLKKHSSFDLSDDCNIHPLIRYHKAKNNGCLNHDETKRFFNRDYIKKIIGIFVNIFGEDKVVHDGLIWKSKKSDFIKVAVYCYYDVEKERTNHFDYLCYELSFNYKRRPNYQLSNEFVSFFCPRNHVFRDEYDKFPFDKRSFTKEEFIDFLTWQKEEYYKLHENQNQ